MYSLNFALLNDHSEDVHFGEYEQDHTLRIHDMACTTQQHAREILLDAALPHERAVAALTTPDNK